MRLAPPATNAPRVPAAAIAIDSPLVSAAASPGVNVRAPFP